MDDMLSTVELPREWRVMYRRAPVLSHVELVSKLCSLNPSSSSLSAIQKRGETVQRSFSISPRDHVMYDKDLMIDRVKRCVYLQRW